MVKKLFEKNIPLFSIIYRIINIQGICIYFIDTEQKYNQVYFNVKDGGTFFISEYSPLSTQFYVNSITTELSNIIYSTFHIKNIMNIKMYSRDINKLYIGNIILLNKATDFEENDYNLISEFEELVVSLVTYKKAKASMGYIKRKDDVILSNMSHEIRTPLNGIIGYTQLLGKTKLDDIQKNYLNAVNTCCYQLLQIVNDVLDYAKLDSGKMKKTIDTFHLEEIINNIEDILGNSIKSKNQIFSSKISEKCPVVIATDKSKLVQILVNLINNANKFTQENGEIKLKIKPYKDNILIFTVKDNGIGISENERQCIFNAFSQLKSTSRLKTGTGLGLAISKKLIHLLNGNIWYESEINKGTTFYFTINYDIPPNYEASLKENVELLNGKYILLVDDNPNNRVVISEYLYEWGMIPITCASALEALRLVVNNRHPFFLGLVDIYMPGINGIELARQIKHEKPDFPLIAISSAVEILDYKDFEYRLEKPINKLRLFNVLCRMISKYNSDSIKSSDIQQCISVKIPSDPCTDKSCRILVAEDVKYSAMLLENVLSDMGLKNIDLAYDGLQAIEMLNKNSYKILFLDIRMPKANGYQVIDYIKQNNINVTIVVVTASVLEDEQQKCKSYDIKYFISKPININEIEKLVKKII